MAHNIMDDIKFAEVRLRDPIPTWKEIDDVVLLPFVEIIQFDIIGIMVDWEGEPFFIPWSNIVYICPRFEEDIPYIDTDSVYPNIPDIGIAREDIKKTINIAYGKRIPRETNSEDSIPFADVVEEGEKEQESNDGLTRERDIEIKRRAKCNKIVWCNRCMFFKTCNYREP